MSCSFGPSSTEVAASSSIVDSGGSSNVPPVPTGALDVTTGITVLEAVERINRELGTLTVIITHNAAMAEMADRVLNLSDGKIIDSHRNEVRLPASKLKW